MTERALGGGVGVDRGAHVHRAHADPPHERRPRADLLVVDEASERFGVAHHYRAGDGTRPRGASAGCRGPDDGHLELGAGGQLGEAVAVVHERRRRHGVDHEAVGRAGRRAHVLDGLDDAAVAGGHHERLARAGEHGGHGREVVDGKRHVFGQAHRHDEVEVRELLAEGRHLLDVGGPHAAPLSAVGVAVVEAVRAGAEIRVAVAQLEGFVAAARPDGPGPGGGSKGLVDDGGVQADA